MLAQCLVELCGTHCAGDIDHGSDDVLRCAGWPVFDVILLGIGPDAHVASLFPNWPQTAAKEGWVLPVEGSPKPPPERITFTMPVINRCFAQMTRLLCVAVSVTHDDPAVRHKGVV